MVSFPRDGHICSLVHVRMYTHTSEMNIMASQLTFFQIILAKCLITYANAMYRMSNDKMAINLRPIISATS